MKTYKKETYCNECKNYYMLINVIFNNNIIIYIF